MGRSHKKNSCLKIITCSRGDEVTDDDHPATSSRTQRTQKGRWSFRKKSAEHRIGSSTVISEIAIDTLDKDNSEEITANNIQCPKNSSVSFSEKLPFKDIQYEIPQATLLKCAPNDVQHDIPETSSVLVESEVVEKHVEIESFEIEELEVVKIQASIRGYLVRRELPKLRNVVKLQAAIRGHLVRRQAVGTLRCALAIFKMQALIRAHNAHVYLKKIDINQEEKTDNCIKLEKKYSSTKSLLSNALARQLLESSPKTKPIYISCDRSKSNSAWKWFERWMSIATTEEEKSVPKCYENSGTLEKISTSKDSKFVGDNVSSEVPSDLEFHDPLLCLEVDNQDVMDTKNDIDTSSKVHAENLASHLPNAASEIQRFDSNQENNNMVVNPSQDDSMTKTMDYIIEEKSFSHNLRPQIYASECGTEISISSTLDSPDRSEAEGEILMEFGSLDKEHNVVNDHSDVLVTTEKAEDEVPMFSQDHTEPKKLDVSDRKIQTLATSVNSDSQSHSEIFTPTNTVENEMHGTPASQKSVNAEMKKRETKKTDGKAITQTAKKSPSNTTIDSNNIKRRNSLGTDSRLDHVGQEPRMSSSDSLPSYMQATESARAKFNANASPKSSPDMYNKETQSKKRHSLPMANGKQGLSPRIQRSPSQSDKNPKGCVHSPLRSAERRWQR